MPAAVVALLQTDPGPDAAENLDRALELIDEAARAGADWVCLPENFNCRGSHRAALAAAEPVPGPLTDTLGARARDRGVWLFAGSFAERSPDPERVLNTSVAFDPEGRVAGVYRKLHLFDVDVGEGARVRESARVVPGDEVVTVATPLGRVGLTICYDLRFPELYLALALRGAVATMVPSNFTVPTGRDHWLPLLSARAIENGQYLIAAATIGDAGGRGGFEAYGRSLVVDPWGTVVACAPDEVGITLARIDTERVERVRARLPSLRHRRPDAYGGG